MFALRRPVTIRLIWSWTSRGSQQIHVIRSWQVCNRSRPLLRYQLGTCIYQIRVALAFDKSMPAQPTSSRYIPGCTTTYSCVRQVHASSAYIFSLHPRLHHHLFLRSTSPCQLSLHLLVTSPVAPPPTLAFDKSMPAQPTSSRYIPGCTTTYSCVRQVHASSAYIFSLHPRLHHHLFLRSTSPCQLSLHLLVTSPVAPPPILAFDKSMPAQPTSSRYIPGCTTTYSCVRQVHASSAYIFSLHPRLHHHLLLRSTSPCQLSLHLLVTSPVAPPPILAFDKSMPAEPTSSRYIPGCTTTYSCVRQVHASSAYIFSLHPRLHHHLFLRSTSPCQLSLHLLVTSPVAPPPILAFDKSMPAQPTSSRYIPGCTTTYSCVRQVHASSAYIFSLHPRLHHHLFLRSTSPCQLSLHLLVTSPVAPPPILVFDKSMPAQPTPSRYIPGCTTTYSCVRQVHASSAYMFSLHPRLHHHLFLRSTSPCQLSLHLLVTSPVAPPPILVFDKSMPAQPTPSRYIPGCTTTYSCVRQVHASSAYMFSLHPRLHHHLFLRSTSPCQLSLHLLVTSPVAPPPILLRSSVLGCLSLG